MSRRKKPIAFFLWHRRIGLVALMLVIILSVTGIMLNHTEDFKLDETSIDADFILDWYDINPQGIPENYTIKEIWISQWNQQLFFNGKPFYTHKGKLQGVIKADDIIAIAFEYSVLLVDNQGELIELVVITSESPINKIALFDNKIALLDLQNNTYLSNKDFTTWHKHTLTVPNSTPGSTPHSTPLWAHTDELSDDKITQLKQAFRGEGLSLERVILDLHSGRFFSASWGIYIMDASAILMILLGLSGLWIWWSRKLKMRQKKHYKKHH